MLNRKLFEVLQKLRKEERAQFGRFVRSPYFNQGYLAEDLIRLYEYILKFKCDEEHPALSKRRVFELFFPGKTFVENAKSPLDTLSSELFKLLKKFLKQQYLEKNHSEVYEAISMARFYRRYDMEDRFLSSIEMARKAQQNSSARTKQFYWQEYLIADEEYQFKGRYDSLSDAENLGNVLYNLDVFYSLLRLEYGTALNYQIHSGYLNASNDNIFQQAILQQTRSGMPLDSSAIRLYRSVFMLLQNTDSEDNFKEFETRLN